MAAAANMELQIDPLTGNRYLYAGANPVDMIDDGHHPQKKSKRKYGFTYKWRWKSVKVPASDVMAAIRQDPSKFFPFPIKCDGPIDVGVACSVKPLPGANDWVDVIAASNTSFTFKARAGHIEGAGSTITFTTARARNGGLIFTVHAHGPQSSNILGRAFLRTARTFVPPYLWRGMSVNIFCHYKSCGYVPAMA